MRGCARSVEDRSNPGNVQHHAYYTASTRLHELYHTDQGLICPAWQVYIMEVGICPMYASIGIILGMIFGSCKKMVKKGLHKIETDKTGG